MKKLLIVFATLLTLAFTSCKEEDKCWEFIITDKTTYTGNDILTPGDTQNIATISQCGMTETEAKNAAKGMESTATITDANGMTTTMTITVKYIEQY